MIVVCCFGIALDDQDGSRAVRSSISDQYRSALVASNIGAVTGKLVNAMRPNPNGLYAAWTYAPSDITTVPADATASASTTGCRRAIGLVPSLICVAIR